MRSSKIRFNIKSPTNKGRATFAIVKDVLNGDERTTSTVSDSRIDSINASFKSGMALDKCMTLIREVREDLYEKLKSKEKVVHNSDNRKLVEDYFKVRYAKKINIRKESKDSMRYDLLRAVECLGALSLYTATEDQIQNCTNKLPSTKQRRTVMRLRQLLKHIGRTDVMLQLAFEDERLVNYLEMNEVDQLIEYFAEDRIMACLIGIGAKAGLRLGEIYALEKSSVRKDGTLLVLKQKLVDGTFRKPKHNKTRVAVVVDDGMDYVVEWLKIPQADKDAYRAGQNRIPRNVVKGCEKLFDDEVKQLTFHDTRHCYGIHLVSKGVPVDLIALSMGNSPEVCKKHYLGFILSDSSIETLKSYIR